jgi:hypothetical protein
MLSSSRSNRASLAKLHIINDAIRSEQHAQLQAAVGGAHVERTWSFRVEPAFARAIDFVVGERLATWTKTTGRAALQLTKIGIESADSVMALEDALSTERIMVADLAKVITETTIAILLGEGRKR